MKKAYLCAVASLFLVTVSCSDDDSDTAFVTVDPNPSEEVALNPDDVSGDIIIENGTIISGDAPTPIGTVDFSLDETTQSGFQKNGFNIIFDAPTNYAGAYIQVQSTDGTMAGNYWNVASPTRSNNITNRKRKNILSQRVSKVNDQEVEIDVDFEDTVTAGTFCYVICIYDTDGNISQPIEVCVEVEAWGGNPNLIGTWNYTKQVFNGETFSVGDEDCDESTVFCNNQDQLVVANAYCNTVTSLPITFNADGTYEYLATGTYTDFDYEASADSCQPVFQDVENESYRSIGNWAYDEEEQRLTLVEFEYIETAGDETYEGTDENGDLLIDADSEITSNSLILRETYTDGDITENFEIFFNR